MDETSNSLLAEIRHGSDPAAWERLIACYTPFIRAILLQRRIDGHDAEDVIQNVLTVVVRRIPEFERQRVGSFRTWLRAISANCLKEYWRNKASDVQARGDIRMAFVQDLADPASELSRYWDKQHDQFVLAHLLELVQHEFRTTTFHAFRRLAIDNEPVDSVASDLGISVNAAFVARSRVLKRLREIGAGMID